MPYIQLEAHLPGITGLLEYRQDAAAPIRALTQFLLRSEHSLTPAERELLATVVSNGNQCRFCASAHKATADALLGEANTTDRLKEDIESTPVSDKMKALLTIASKVRESGLAVKPEHIEAARESGATDIEIHDTVLIAALFCYYNRYVDGLATVTPSDPAFYQSLADRLVKHGYNRLPQGYDHLKNSTHE